jgi:GDP-fucose transporter C1
MGPRVKVLATILFHSSCAISVTLVSKSALNGIDAPVVLLAFQTTVQVVLLTVVGIFMGWVKLRRPMSVCLYRPSLG